MTEDEIAAIQARAEREARQRVGEEQPPRVGGILTALRLSPLVGADLNLSREETLGRNVGP
ncbi:hypothetical protein [Roseicella sp. DB1501]|uniref:hypothetical protein n=1 Tax=Roseicella sp. DB1501 TaxID=2730925 RepID=UPI0014931008|nr:hypothetical protein [Roseicella sp. DB1501]NOG73938.1 hypothetical protein [Roseicella sp. DB1501]